MFTCGKFFALTLSLHFSKEILGFVDSNNRDIEFTSIRMEGVQYNNYASYNITQVFTNTSNNASDISYYFPNDSEYCSYDCLFIVDGKKIKPQLRSKEEAKKEYNEAKQQGHHVMHGEMIGNGLNRFNLGNLPAKKVAEVHLKVSLLADLDKNSIFYKIPLTVAYQSEVKTSLSSIGIKDFKFSTKIITNHDIKEATINVKNCKSVIETRTAFFELSSIPTEDCIIIKTVFSEDNLNFAVSSDNYIAISTYPNFESKDKTNSEFYFLVDQSGSMAGSRITKAKEALKFFLQSLPVGCRYAIYGFGSNYVTHIPPSDYNNETFKYSMKVVERIKAVLGGTEIYQPLEYIINTKSKEGYAKQVFVLTD